MLGPKTQTKGENILNDKSTLSISVHRPTLHYEMVTRRERQLILFFFQNAAPTSIFTLRPRHQTKDGPLIPVPRAKVLISSKPLLYAILAYASYSKTGAESDINTLQYMDQCYKHLRKAIATASVVDIVYACYTLIVLAFETAETTEVILAHLGGVCQGIRVLQSNPAWIGTREFLWMERMWQNIFHRIYYRLQRTCDDPSALASQVKEIYGILKSCNPFMLRDKEPLLDGWKEQKIQRFHSLGIHLQYCFIHYLLQTSFARDIEGEDDLVSIAYRFDEILTQILKAVPEIDCQQFVDDLYKSCQYDYIGPGFPGPIPEEPLSYYDITLSLYFSSIIIRGVLWSEPYCTLKSAAVSLCRIVALRSDVHPPGSLFEIRNLFLAGLVLTKYLYPIGNSESLVL